MTYSTISIAETVHASAPAFDYPVSILLTDSRSLTYPEQTLFFALRTATGNGHRYISDLYNKGVRAFVVDHLPSNAASMPEAAWIVVPDVLRALQQLAASHRASFSIPVIGITGSRGKTTLKEWLYSLLHNDFSIVRSPRSYNSQIGVPLSIWEMNRDTCLAIFEAGISKQGEMNSLESIIRPTIGIITNIGSEHSDGFSSIEDKCREKVQLLRNCDCIIYCSDDETVNQQVNQAEIKAKKIAWSCIDPQAPLFISSISHVGHSTDIHYSYLGTDGSVTIPFFDEADIQNAIHALAVMLCLDRPADVIRHRMASLPKVGTRMDVMEGVNGCLVIHDSYTCDLHSLTPALDFMMRRATTLRSCTVILSDVMLESLPANEVYADVARLLSTAGITRIIGIGNGISANSKYFGPGATFYPDTTAFLEAVTPGDFDNELILVKGAPEFEFQRICDFLELRRVETVLDVNLDAIVHNYNLYRAAVKPTTGIVCMVKASGYGAGSYELAKTLQSQGASYLAVAVLDEGVDLRRAGITMPIMVLNPRVVNYRMLFANNLEPEIYSFDILNEIIREGRKYGITDFPVHIKLDTGMHRLGFLEQDMDTLASILNSQRVIKAETIFSHLSCADIPSEDDYTMKQFEIFDRCCSLLQAQLPYRVRRHILNSTGITRFPDYQYDLVRLGICLYGIPTMTDGSQDSLIPVSSLHTSVISIKEWPAGTTVGYSRKGLLKRNSLIATIPVGYADGINRHFGNGNMKVWINGHLCPTVGNICMDACMVDVTDAKCHVGDSVEIFGQHVSVMQLAETLDTIPYEILTSVSTRVKRVYYRE
ncbi:putative uncharacterized protein [Bacteroides sp. CAG:927]|jgi:Alr-MurF fusion protein|nr:putative uncharacterized protein [Bacteroides sp. CAG:927]